MRLGPPAGAPAEDRPRLPRAIVVVGILAALAFAAVTTGAVRLPDLEGALEDLTETLGTWTYGLVAAMAFLETGAFVGLVAPGETAVVLGGVVAAQGEVDLALLLPLAWLAAAAGDFVSFLLGRRLGRRFILQHGPRLGISHARLDQVDLFFDRHGPKAILIGRFIGIIRAVAPFLAGASGMRLRAFVPWSLLGTAAWATTFTLVGYVFHASFGTAADLLTRGALVLAVLAAVVLLVRHRRAVSRARVRERERRRELA